MASAGDLNLVITADGSPAIREIHRVRRHLWAAKIPPLGWFIGGYFSALLGVAVGWWIA